MSNVPQNTSTTERLPLSIDEAADAILARWEDADEDQPSEDEGSEATQDISEDETMDAPEIDETDEDYDLVEIDEDPEKETEETEDEDDDSDYEEDEESSTSLDDDAVVDIQVDGNTVQASVKDLKRLYGQEAALTRKSQETARQRKDAEDALSKTNLIMQRMLEKAEERWKPYSEVDMLVASKSMDTEDFAQLRKEAQDAFESLKFLREEADDFYNTVQEQNNQNIKSAAKEAVKVLKDRIPNWSNAVYDDIRGYAIGVGLPEDQVNQYVDPVVIEILNKARLYDQSKKTASIKKKSASSKKILRTSKAPETQKRRAAAKQAETRKRLRSSGADMDDIANALLSRWET